MNRTKLRKYFAKELKFKWFRQYQAQAIFDFLIEAAEFCQNGVLLDAGAGRQRYKPFFQECIYISQEHTAGIKLKNMKDIVYDLISPIDEKIPLKDNSLDAILSTSVIEHLRYPDKFFYEAYRVLKPGGKLFINVPFCHPEHEVPYDFNRPTRYGLKRWFEDSGFCEIVIKPSSSSTEAVCAFSPSAIQSDILKSDKTCRQILNDLLEKKNGFVNAILRLPFLLIIKFIFTLIELFFALFKYLIDRGPRNDTFMPVGWIAVGMKPGRSQNVKVYTDKKDFLAACKI